MIKQLAHVCIMSTNLGATQKFYDDLLGLETIFSFYKEDKLIGFYLGMDNRTFIEVFLNENASENDAPLINHLCLEVENMDAVIEKARAQGYEISDKKKGVDNTWQSWIYDPSDVRIELFEYTTDSTQFTGVDCEVDW